MRFKLITLIIIFAFISNAMAQLPIDEETGKVIFTDVVRLEGMTNDEIFEKAKLWVVSTLKSGDNMVELDGTNSDKIIGTGNIVIPQNEINEFIKPLKYFSNYTLNFKFIVFFKDNRLKYSVENFNFSFISTRKAYNTGLVDIIDMTDIMTKKQNVNFSEAIRVVSGKYVENLIKDFITSMNKKEDNNW
jgi:uncharacterized protein with TBP-like fold DUF4468